jgi:hypothetical protein
MLYSQKRQFNSDFLAIENLGKINFRFKMHIFELFDPLFEISGKVTFDTKMPVYDVTSEHMR